MFRIVSVLIIIAGFTGTAFAQFILTEEEAVAKAIQASRNLKAADYHIKQQKQLVKSAFNLPNPEFFWESPTGSFYNGSITQSLDFPTVYGRQVQLQKQQVIIAQIDKMVTQAEVTYQVRQLYLAIQYTRIVTAELKKQDSVYFLIQQSAKRQFDAGQIDYLQQVFTENEYGELHNQFEQATATLNALESQLQFLTGLNEPVTSTVLQLFTLPDEVTGLTDSAISSQNPAISLLQQEIEVNRKNLQLQRSKALPGLAFGYFNQGERETPTRLRFNFGVTIPLWFWQYKSNIQAAKTGVELAREKAAGFQQQLNYELKQRKNDFRVSYQAYNYYLKTGLPKADEIIKTATRFFESGESDFISYLRNISTAYETRMKFFETLNNLNQSIITINYLTGKL